MVKPERNLTLTRNGRDQKVRQIRAEVTFQRIRIPTGNPRDARKTGSIGSSHTFPVTCVPFRQPARHGHSHNVSPTISVLPVRVVQVVCVLVLNASSKSTTNRERQPAAMSTTISRRSWIKVTSASLATALIPFGAAVGAAGTSATFARNTPRIDCGPDGPSNPGLIDETSYQGPFFFQTIAWDPELWEVGDIANLAVSLSIKASVDPIDCGYGNGASDLLTLSHREYDTSVILFETYERGMWTFEVMSDSMQQPGWVSNLHLPQGSEPLLIERSDIAQSLATVARDIDNSGHIVYQEIHFPPDNDEMIRSATLHLWEPDAYVGTLDDLAGIEAEDFELFTVVDRDQILDAIG
jgi:hypothetical protein